MERKPRSEEPRRSQPGSGQAGPNFTPEAGGPEVSGPVQMPQVSLRPAKLVTSAALRKAADPAPSTPAVDPLQLLSKEIRDSQQTAQNQGMPLGGDRPQLGAQGARKPAPSPTFGYTANPAQKPPSEASQWQELEGALKRAFRTVSPYTSRLLLSLGYSLSYWLSWRRLWVYRKPVGAVALVAFVVMFWDSPLLQRGYQAVGNSFDPLVESVKARAAFNIVDDFDSGVGEWWLDQGLVPEQQEGAVRIAGLALHRGTMDLVSYRMDFEGKIENRSVGWLVRAADRESYYAFKLLERGRGKNKSYQLVRYPVVKGQIEESQKAEIDVPADVVEDSYNRFSVRIRDNQLITLINGRSVDFWTDSRLPKGGVGFWVERGGSGLIRRMAVSGNEDFLGLTLYGAMETVEAVADFFKSLLSDPEEVAQVLQRGMGYVREDFTRVARTPVRN